MDNLLKRNLKGPPFCRLAVSDYIKCARLVKASNEAIAILKTCMNDNSSLWTEIDILEKSVYKIKLKWRLEPLYKGTKQVLKCMKILKCEQILSTISTALESVLGLDGKTLIPSKQYLQFLLVKIIGVGKLAVQTIAYCEYVHNKLLSKIQIGHVLSSVMSFTAFISRIWVLSHTLLVQLQSCYNSIYSLHLLANDADYKWLPEDVLLPVSFPLDVDSIIARSSASSLPTKSSGSTKLPAVRSEPRLNRPVTKQLPVAMSANNEDFGVVISRESFTKLVETADEMPTTGKRKLVSKEEENKVCSKKAKKKVKSVKKSEQTVNEEKATNSNNTEVVKSKKNKKKRKRGTNAGGESTDMVKMMPVSSPTVSDKIKAGKTKKSKSSAKKPKGVKNLSVEHHIKVKPAKKTKRKKLKKSGM